MVRTQFNRKHLALGWLTFFVIAGGTGCSMPPKHDTSVAPSRASGEKFTPDTGAGVSSSGVHPPPVAIMTSPAHSDTASPPTSTADTSGPMAVCLYEAEQLSRLGTASQKALVTGLYRNIRAAQVYSPMAQKLSPGTVSTVTPLYEFAVNDACNSVEQALLSVLKKQVPVTGGGRD